jgi:hypothetical protein
MIYLVGMFFRAESGVAGVPFVGTSLDSGFVLSDVSLLSDVSFVGVLSMSVGVSFLRCSGVGVSGVVGELIFDASCGVLWSLFVHSSRRRVRFAGVLAVDEAATRSSEDRFVCENDGDVIM